MTNEEFLLEVEASINRSKRVLIKKGIEYSGPIDRLENFKRAGAAEGVEPTQALMGMVTKQFVSVEDMVKNPFLYKESQWNEKITDIRNYTFLLDALLRDMGVI